MPYSKAHWFMLALLPVTLLAFWPSYFGILRDAPLAHHLHGVTGTLWILLIAGQSFAIHSGRFSLHRTAGRLVFVLAPLLIGAFSLVTWAGAQKAAVQHPFYEAFGRPLLTGDALLVFVTALLVYLALRLRRRVHLHSALMISTVMGLLPPILARVFNVYVPGLIISGPETLYRFGPSLLLSVAITAALGIVLGLCYRRHGWPWWMASGVVALLYLLYLTLGQTAWWSGAVAEIATWSPIAVFAFGAFLGAIACVLGWRHGKAIEGLRGHPAP
ncbi:MAG: hypothetical protein WD397_08795 [Wenzhouxiangellaceae bacterium]